MWGLSLQFLFGLLILRWKFGKMFFDCIGDKVCVKRKNRSHLRFFQKHPLTLSLIVIIQVDTFLGFTDAGSSFTFGYLVNQQPFLVDNLKNGSVAREVAQAINSSRAVNTIVVFKALSTVYFFSFLVSMLFYWGVLQWLVIKIGWLLQVTIGIYD